MWIDRERDVFENMLGNWKRIDSRRGRKSCVQREAIMGEKEWGSNFVGERMVDGKGDKTIKYRKKYWQEDEEVDREIERKKGDGEEKKDSLRAQQKKIKMSIKMWPWNF